MATEETQTFSAKLRATSWAAHGRAQHSPFMAALFGGTLAGGRFAELVAQEYFVYDVLEKAAAELRGHPVAGPFARPELDRRAVLEADLAELLGAAWASGIAPLAATQAYCDRLREVCFTWPGGFIAHHYVRYMGDLSGGQQIKKMIARHCGPAGTRFYDFAQIPDPDAFKEQYREQLDRLTLDTAEQQRVIDEVLLAYELTTRMLAAL
ncbi:MAG: biliverdin-producing heme oxygenase [Dehalococcoidia bacterium]|nr:biliverdin-producing heme oxygenase [Dehalococcoidia bacterium]